MPKNGEEAALARVGREMYEKIFRPYTIKQWAKEPQRLAASVLNRIPVRDDWNDRYFPDDQHQFLPAHGYTALVAEMLSHPNITVWLDVDYFAVRDKLGAAAAEEAAGTGATAFEKLFFTGPIDEYFAHLGWKRLEYRSIVFQKEYERPRTKRGYFQVREREREHQ